MGNQELESVHYVVRQMFKEQEMLVLHLNFYLEAYQ